MKKTLVACLLLSGIFILPAHAKNSALKDQCEVVYQAFSVVSLLENICGFTAGKGIDYIHLYNNAGCRKIVPPEYEKAILDGKTAFTHARIDLVGKESFCTENQKLYEEK